MEQYLPVLALTVLAVIFVVLSVFASKLLAPRRPSVAKSAPYECGIVPSREPPERFPVQFYVVAMLFVMFDIEIIFLYPYAVSHGTLGMFGFGAIVLFSALFFLTFVYEVARGGLDWGPIQRDIQVDADVVVASGLAATVPGAVPAVVSAERTAASTIRRVGLEGRVEDPTHTVDDSGRAA